jgi:hypothetical protein
MIHLDHNRPSVFNLDTEFPTIVLKNHPVIDPNVIDPFMKKKNCLKEHHMISYSERITPNISFIRDIASGLLDMYHFNHNKSIWYIDFIRYELDNQKKPVDSGLAWHCENDNYANLITVIFYLHKDNTIKDGNLRYIDYHNVKQTIEINSGTIIIMDGEVMHKPENPTGSGRRDLITISFKKL